MLWRTSVLSLAMLALAACSENPEPIRVTGSSTVYPFTKSVAAAFVQKDAKHVAPAIESTGTGNGVHAFCKKDAEAPRDILDSSRRMTRAEFNECKANGVGDIIEVRIGLDGIALAESTDGPKLSLTSKDLYLALAANPRGKPNTAKNWSDVNPSLPAIPIQVLGPPRSSGTRDMFASLIMRSGCIAAMPEAEELLKNSDPAQFEAACLRIRADGPYVEVGENHAEIVAALEKSPKALGLIGYSYLEQNPTKLRAAPIDGIAPTAETIATGKYAACRPLYLYVKKSSLKFTPGLKDFLRLYIEMAAAGGPLVKIGLIAMSESSRKSSAETIENEYPLSALDLS
ncbi:substrate-binding domain-containing protein [Sphingomonas sp. AOB5]|uniref:substrate-binding domain-containing protein n=1 Tax=Sphingomonas sp. AOB5 TaxID=3034017 RepID=UPI0023F89AA2|nr:substrate-binding domain-containing protein [Sphingomonas sp. AOB5]MDF7774572.1 substrate-binding domain-containing protein [Sphingomonas sp. AOB5]